MISNTNIRAYRYPYAQARRPQLHLNIRWRQYLALTGQQKLVLVVLVALACCVGAVNSLVLHTKAASTQTAIQQIQVQHSALDSEHIHLLAARAQLSSKARITGIVKDRLQLFEPVAGQVQHM